MHGMLSLPTALLVYSLFAFSSFAKPVGPRSHLAQLAKQQHPESYVPQSRLSRPHSASHLDAVPNSVGILFTTPDIDEVIHAWLPLGKHIFTRDAPELPLHPSTARITTMIQSTPQRAMPEHLNRVQCRIFPKYNRTMEVQNPSALAIEIKMGDGLVRLEEVAKRPWREIEAYECG